MRVNGGVKMQLNALLMVNSFKIFNLEIRFYALTMIAALVGCAIIAYFLFPKRGFKADLVLDVMIAVIPCALICARLWYVLLDVKQFIYNGKFTLLAKVGEEYVGALAIWQGGLAIHGGVMGGALGLYIISKIKKVSVGDLFDIGATMLPFGQAVGRWGNFFNQEVYGLETSVTWFPYSVYIESTGKYHLALFFYEMVLNVLLFAFLFWFFFKSKGKNRLYATAFYLIGYGVIRSVLEPLRTAEFQMGNFGIPSSVLTSIFMLVLGAGVLVYVVYKDVKVGNFWWKNILKSDYGKDVAVQTATKTETVEQTETEVVAQTETVDDVENKAENQ